MKNITRLMFSSRFLYWPFLILATNLHLVCFLLFICLFVFVLLYFRRCIPLFRFDLSFRTGASIAILPNVTNLSLNLQFRKLSNVKLLLWYINTFSRSSDDSWYPVSEISEYDSSPSTIVTTKFVSEI